MRNPDATDKRVARGKRRWLQMRLRTALLLVLLLCAALAALTRPTRTQRLVEEIEQMGGDVEVQAVGPQWIRRRFGRETRDYRKVGPFDRLTAVRLGLRGGALSPRPSDVPAPWLEKLNDLPHLQELNLSYTPVGHDEIAQLRGLPRLRVLRLDGLDIDDSTLKHLSRFTALEELYVEGAPITDEGLRHLAQLPNLRRLSLRRCKSITDAGLAHLSDMPNLELLLN